MTNILLYIKSSLWDFILLAVACIGLEYTLYNVFYILPALQYSVWPALMSTAALLLLFAVAYNRRTTRIGGIIYALALVVVLVASASACGDRNFLDDYEGNLFYFALVTAFVPTFGFLMTRKRLGVAMFFVLGGFACAWTQFFYERYAFALLLCFVISALALIVYKNYQRSAATAASVQKLSFLSGFCVAVAAVAISVVAACGLWFGVVQHLHPGAVVIELVNEERALEEVEVKGVSGIYQTPNLELTSSQTNDDARTTDDMKLDADGNPVPAGLKSSSTSQEQATGTFKGLNLESLDDDYDLQTNQLPSWTLPVLLAALILIIIGYFVGRRIWRNVRLSRMCSGSPAQQIQAIYPFLASRLALVGLGIPIGSTLGEYVENNRSALERFDATAGASFAGLTQVYADTVYGNTPASQEQAEPFARYYRGFWRAARKELGTTKYMIRSFRL